MTTNGAPLMTGTVNVFLAMCMRDDDFPHFLSYHCIIHQQALRCKILNMRHVMGICMKIVNSIRGSHQRRMFRSQLEENESDYQELLYHADVYWLSRSIFLQTFRDLLREVKGFLESKDETYIELTRGGYDAWITDSIHL
ncbi:DUF4371 domain-containing protein [Trichonephila clavipes]|nr:DUF4371 domain-containing protein [Trichonephila clavipes]